MDFNGSPTGRVIKTLTGYRTFIPHPLPPVIEWNAPLACALSTADHLLGMLAREGARLANPHLLIRPFMTRESVLSSKIEGTQATIAEILADDAGAQVDRNPDDLAEVINYILALEHGLKRLTEFPLSLRLIREMHGILMQGVRGAHATPGDFRTSQNWIGSPGCTLNTAKFVPPAPEHLSECLGMFEKFLHDRTLPALIHIALCHYQFEAIHPFIDGNGRMGRLLIMLMLIERKILGAPLLYLSAFFEASRDEYYRLLYSVSSQGTWNDWLIYFLNGVAVQGQDALSRVERINRLIADWQQCAGSKGTLTTSNIVKGLAANPFLKVNRVAEQLEVAYTTAQKAVEFLEKEGVISCISAGKRDKVYCAVEILRILEEPARIRQDDDV